MDSDRTNIGGDWFGVMVHSPSRGLIHVSIEIENGSFKGEWDFPKLMRGVAKKGTFTGTRFANWLNLRITSKPLRNVHLQLTLVKANGESMITGVIPLEGSAIPFATVTLFCRPQGESDMDGLCPDREFRFAGTPK